MAHDDLFIPDPDQKPWLLITRIAQLTLELYNADTNTLVPGGVSRSAANQVTAEETYALAFFAAVSIARR
jgi:hypothetical protein